MSDEKSTERRVRDLTPTREIYFVRAQTLGLIKIGIASCHRSRLRSLQVGSPDQLAVIGCIVSSSAEKLECELHSRFRHLRQHGEWFAPGDELLAYIAEHGQNHEADRRNLLRDALSRAYLRADPEERALQREIDCERPPTLSARPVRPRRRKVIASVDAPAIEPSGRSTSPRLQRYFARRGMLPA